MKINYSSINRLTRWQLFQFIEEVLTFAETHEEGMPELYTNKQAELQAVFDIFDEALVQERRTSPEGLIEAEENRDYAIRKIYAILREYSDYRFNKDKEIAAKGLLEVFKAYGTGSQIAKLDQDSETALIINLLQDFQKLDPQQYIMTLSLTEAVDYLNSKNKLFKETQSSRRTDEALFVSGVVKTAREDAQRVVLEFADVVNALTIVEGEEKYSVLKLKINSLLDKYVARSKRSTKKKEEETPEEVTQ